LAGSIHLKNVFAGCRSPGQAQDGGVMRGSSETMILLSGKTNTADQWCQTAVNTIETRIPKSQLREGGNEHEEQHETPPKMRTNSILSDHHHGPKSAWPFIHALAKSFVSVQRKPDRGDDEKLSQ